jgi:heptosyltransferase-1
VIEPPAHNTGSRNLESLLMVRLGAMGDIIHALPAAAALRQAYPNATLGWLIEERWAELLCTLPTPRCGPRSEQRPLVDNVHTVNTKKWRAHLCSLETAEQAAAALSDVRSRRYQTAIDFQGAVKSAMFAAWSGAESVIGSMQPRENVAAMFYGRRVLPRGTHVIDQNLSISENIGGQSLPAPHAALPRDSNAESRICHWLKERGITDFTIINPTAGWGAKQWPASRYGELAALLFARGLRTVINYGPGEQAIAQEVKVNSGGKAEPFCPSITDLIALTRRARLFIGGDTGPLHLAAALRVPVVAIYGPTDPTRTGPYGTRSIVLRSQASVTSHKRYLEPEAGLLSISVEQVADAALAMSGAEHV